MCNMKNLSLLVSSPDISPGLLKRIKQGTVEDGMTELQSKILEKDSLTEGLKP